ncbi:MAG TPA: UDP-3-O-(3-hydroxymyristoyl)glucosamine N-acyltransferase [Cyclobacteriaceae bacterium]|jgi:UDP-3-O-[3-hydroxymyristoyl] glucosamine N-acyltransferase
MEFSIEEIAVIVGGEIEGNGSDTINKLSRIQDAKEGSISFLANLKYEPFIYKTEATAIIVGTEFKARKKLNVTLIRVEDPYVGFTLLLEEYHRLISLQREGVEEPSYLGNNTTIGEKIYRGAFSYIGSNVKIGDNVKIYPQAYIGDNTTVGNNTIIHSGVKIYPGTKIGTDVVLHAGAVIGSDGFGFAPQDDGSYKTIPQMGNVIIHDKVSIGANTTIDCATLINDSTEIGEGTKLDNLIMIAHNVHIGKNTVIAAQSGVSGSTRVGDNCVVAGQAGIIGHLEIANNTTIAAQSGVGKSIKEPGQVLMGSPGFDHKQYLRVYTVFKKLPDLESRIKELEQKVLNLPTI